MMPASSVEQTGRPARDDEYGLLLYMTVFAMMLEFVGDSLCGIVFDSRPRCTGG